METSEQLTLPGVYIKTFGCQMNEYDSEKIFALLSTNYRPVTELDAAELVIVNTCSVREKAAHKLYSLLGELQLKKKKNPKLLIGVSGCLAQQEGLQIIKRNSSVDFVVGTHNLSLIPPLVQASKQGKRHQVAVDYRDGWEDLPEHIHSLQPFNTLVEGQSEEASGSVSAFGAFYNSVRAMVSIQRGCNKNCAFCVVPNTRGPEVSRDPEEIVREVSLKVRMGAKEVMLLGQTVNSYGRDLSPRYSFEKLIERISEIDGLQRIRFTSPHPQEVRKGFVALYKQIPALCPHIHLPLQSGSDRVLKLMNRNYHCKRYLDIVDSLREACPDIAISSDFIVGFPTESDREFEQTLEMINRVEYSFSYSFQYSVRPNTVAKTQFAPEQLIPPEVARERLYRLQELQDQLCLKFNRKFIGSEVEVLVEGQQNKLSSKLMGRIPHNTLAYAEIDPQQESSYKLGSLCSVLVQNASARALQGKLVSTNK